MVPRFWFSLPPRAAPSLFHLSGGHIPRTPSVLVHPYLPKVLQPRPFLCSLPSFSSPFLTDFVRRRQLRLPMDRGQYCVRAVMCYRALACCLRKHRPSFRPLLAVPLLKAHRHARLGQYTRGISPSRRPAKAPPSGGSTAVLKLFLHLFLAASVRSPPACPLPARLPRLPARLGLPVACPAAVAACLLRPACPAVLFLRTQGLVPSPWLVACLSCTLLCRPYGALPPPLKVSPLLLGSGPAPVPLALSPVPVSAPAPLVLALPRSLSCSRTLLFKVVC